MVDKNKKVKIIEGHHSGKKGKVSNIQNIKNENDDVVTLYDIDLENGRKLIGVKRENIIEL